MPPATTALQSYQDAAVQVVRDVFGTMLRIETLLGDGGQATRPVHPVTGAVYFAGAWRGAALLECDAEQAYLFTSRLMSISQPSSVNDDVRDAIGEVVNMIAGNLKSLMPPDTALSMPSVVEGSSYTLRIIGENDSVRMTFDSNAGPFSVTLVQVLDD